MTSAIRDGERWRSEKAPSQNALPATRMPRSEEHTSELQSRLHLVCRLLLEKKKPFNQLPDTDQNFGKIAQYYAGDKRILIGPAAPKKDFVTEAPPYNIIYFATHAQPFGTER